MQNFTHRSSNTPENSVKSKVLAALAILVSGLLFVEAGYFIPRENFALFFACYTALFGLFYWLWLQQQLFSFRQFLILALVLRLLLLFATPELSNDFYRFLWDGELIARGINPYAHAPNELSSIGSILTDSYMMSLYNGMGELSQQHYSCYPPLNQVFFLMPALVSDSIFTNLVVLKLIIIAADLGAIFMGRKILLHLGLETNRIWLYALNPFVILEFSGNVHFEGVMIFLVLCAVYFLLTQNWLMSAIFIGLAIHVKLIPLLLIPFFLKKLKWRKSIGYIAMSAVIVLVIAQLFLTPVYFDHMMSSIGLYFVSFEFNAGLFYVAREIGFAGKGYDMIATIGPVFSVIALVLILLLAVFKSFKSDKDIFVAMLFGLLIYYGFATTVHPWYIAMILIVSIFTQYRFGLVWSFLVMLSYSAYGADGFRENAVLLCTEYHILVAVVIYEIRKYWRKDAVEIGWRSFFSNEK